MTETRSYSMGISVAGHLLMASIAIGLHFAALCLLVWWVEPEDLLKGMAIGVFMANAVGTMCFAANLIWKDFKMEYRP